MAAGASLRVERLAARGLRVGEDTVLHCARGLGGRLCGSLATCPATPLCAGLRANRRRGDEQCDERQRSQRCQKDAASV